jgi:hypothetical protein
LENHFNIFIIAIPLAALVRAPYPRAQVRGDFVSVARVIVIVSVISSFGTGSIANQDAERC